MSVQPTAPVRRKRPLRIAAAFAVLIGLAVYLLVQYVTGGPGAPKCVVRAEGDGEPYELSPEQAANAATIAAVGSARGLPERAVTIALATAMQESGLRNIDFGDRDSVGLFQQRPSQDWGTVEQIMDPVYAAGEFYTHLAEVPGYSRLPLTVAAQKVQRSGYPQAYAKHEARAALLTGALTGRDPAALSCSQSRPVDASTGGAAAVRDKLVREFGPDVLPRTAADGAADAKRPGKRADAGGGAGKSAEKDTEKSNVLTVPVQRDAAMGGGGPEQRGWELASWAVAHAGELRIEQITYGGRRWSAADAEEGWQKADGDAPGRDSTDVRIVTAQ
ncbi:heavy metal transporter [Streptomyces sp. NPDC003077]|uniref:heavy metal transporter n=1 Tax=Streptomyces sp. NPDC003077 TaxID=3154443 RepID=UPI0033A68AA9